MSDSSTPGLDEDEYYSLARRIGELHRAGYPFFANGVRLTTLEQIIEACRVYTYCPICQNSLWNSYPALVLSVWKGKRGKRLYAECNRDNCPSEDDQIDKLINIGPGPYIGNVEPDTPEDNKEAREYYLAAERELITKIARRDDVPWQRLDASEQLVYLMRSRRGYATPEAATEPPGVSPDDVERIVFHALAIAREQWEKEKGE